MGNKEKSSEKNIEMTTLHFAKLIFRSLIFISAVFVYAHNNIYGSPTFFGNINENNVYYMFVWLVFMIEMLLRFFPSKWESMGCQKQFGRNYKPAAERSNKYNKTAKSTFIVIISWISLNGLIGAMHIIGALDRGIMLLIALFYSVCDVICILFFCPFQEWIMKNKCCMTCRIYNWDYVMMFTPLIFVKNIYSWSLLAVAAALFIKWEIAVKTHPERFFENTNMRLSCAECDERLCRYKRAIKRGRRCKKTIQKDRTKSRNKKTCRCKKYICKFFYFVLHQNKKDFFIKMTFWKYHYSKSVNDYGIITAMRQKIMITGFARL